jgi:hypothetical protein
MANDSLDRSSTTTAQVLLGLGVATAVVAFFVLQRPPEPPSPAASPSTTAARSAVVAPPPRCRVVHTGSLLGDEGDSSGSSSDDARLAPYAAEVGRAAVIDGGYVVGAKRYRDSKAEVGFLRLNPEGKGAFQSLGHSRADLGAPTVAAITGGVLIGTVEANAGGLALRLVKSTLSTKPKWGAEIQLQRGESHAYDLAALKDQGFVAYTMRGKGKNDVFRVMLQAFAVGPLTLRGKAVSVSSSRVDAEAPRLLRRGAGFWLVYVARSRLALPKKPGDKALGRSPKQERFSAEKIEPSWLEVLPLDGAAKPLGSARSVTPRDGHVLAYDAALQGESLLLAWRDDDTPSGAGRGRVLMQRVGAGGEGSSQMVAERDVGSGVPALVGDWLALPDSQGRMRLAPIQKAEDTGSFLSDALRLESQLGMAQPLVAQSDSLLLAQPRGRAIGFAVARCRSKP